MELSPMELSPMALCPMELSPMAHNLTAPSLTALRQMEQVARMVQLTQQQTRPQVKNRNTATNRTYLKFLQCLFDVSFLINSVNSKSY